jgi:hypothetical protein
MRTHKSNYVVMAVLLWLSGTLSAQLHLKLKPNQAKNFGVHSELMQSTESQIEQLGEARVLDPSVFYSQISDLDLNQTSVAFSRAQLASVNRLFHNQQNASRAALAQASLLVRTDENNFSRAQTALRTTWGDTVADWSSAERAQRSAQLRSGRASFLRLELNDLQDASSRFSTHHASLEWLGVLPNADAQTGRAGALLWLKPGAPALTRLPIQLSRTAVANPSASTSLLIPRSAVLRINSGYFVFIETEPLAFEMRELIAATRSPDGWRVQQGFRAGERIVDAGAASLLTMARGAGEEE